jgi:regulator of sigma E protease
MTLLLNAGYHLLVYLFILAVVIFIHEMGHYLACKKLGIEVESFALGFGPVLYSFNYWNTEFSLRAIPLGGFIKPAGIDKSPSESSSDEYFGKAWYKRLLVAYAGPLMNFVLAFVIFVGLVFIKDSRPQTLANTSTNISHSVTLSSRICWYQISQTYLIISSKLGQHQNPGLMGPIGIFQAVSQAASSWVEIFSMMAAISIAIGLFNILPIPLLDGGFAVLFLWEGLTGKFPSKTVVFVWQVLGIAFLGSILLLATVGDLGRLLHP